ncbi:MAG: hypothetical protein FD143_3012 [Ignavibacteria bacterium]|nr:MAG: hypothetical protein FD143_3012 [Ignavibacteria bacterium]
MLVLVGTSVHEKAMTQPAGCPWGVPMVSKFQILKRFQVLENDSIFYDFIISSFVLLQQSIFLRKNQKIEDILQSFVTFSKLF